MIKEMRQKPTEDASPKITEVLPWHWTLAHWAVTYALLPCMALVVFLAVVAELIPGVGKTGQHVDTAGRFFFKLRYRLLGSVYEKYDLLNVLKNIK